jgi:2-oxoisovalerate dehydrogenase E1 component
MLEHPEIALFGEDVAKAGGVYHVTTGLLDKFGPRRVYNTPLDETTILGSAIGMAHLGFIPIPEIQFLAYYHNAEDQIRGEAATLSFFSSERFTNPMVVRIAGLAYQKGFGGHFHNDNSLAALRDVPGLIVACPSNGRDAVGMLRSCVAAAREEGRVALFIEPIALYMTKDIIEKGDGGWQFEYPAPGFQIPVGEIAVWGESDRLAIVTYGNGYYLARQAAGDLENKFGLAPKIVDIRWIAPLNEEAIAREVGGCECVLVLDECRRTGSQSEAIVTALIERCARPPRIARLTAEDSFVPLAAAANLVLPSREGIVRACVELAGLDARATAGSAR